MTAAAPVADPWAHTAQGGGGWTPTDTSEGGRWVPASCSYRDRAVQAAGGLDALDITASRTLPEISVYTVWSTRAGVPVVADEVASTCRHACWVPDTD